MKNTFKSPLFIFTVIAIIFAIYFFILPVVSSYEFEFTKTGAFGDSFGALTALFSALAFGGLMLTIWQQQQEIEETRQEVKTQHFENILFRMLEVHTGIVNGLDIHDEKDQVTHSGRDCFPRWKDILYFDYHDSESSWRAQLFREGKSPENEDYSLEIIRDAYTNFWDSWNKDLGHYFRFLYNIFKHIDESSEKDKKKYANIIRAQLSDYELLILFYNCLHTHGSEKFKPLAEKYALFDNLSPDLLFDEKHKGLYLSKAFGN